ncbi:hypothetical protein TURU_099141 [Turdus rufiventris]|nr:hypothetical protein TURU_099141 [Turdus rufiventris]
MRAHRTERVKDIVKKMKSELAVIPGGMTKELQPLDIGIICSFKAKVQLLWEKWMMKGEHSYTKTGRLRRASYATACQWILSAWGKVTATTIIRGFAEADIIPGLTSNAIESVPKVITLTVKIQAKLIRVRWIPPLPNCLFLIRRTKSLKVSWKMKPLTKQLMNEK